MIDSSYKDDNPLASGSCLVGTAYEKYQHQDVDSPQICKNNPLKINPSTQLEAQITQLLIAQYLGARMMKNLEEMTYNKEE